MKQTTVYFKDTIGGGLLYKQRSLSTISMEDVEPKVEGPLLILDDHGSTVMVPMENVDHFKTFERPQPDPEGKFWEGPAKYTACPTCRTNGLSCSHRPIPDDYMGPP